MAAIAAAEAIEDAKSVRKTSIIYIVAHNLGDIKPGSNFPDMLPTLASRVKNKLKIKNPGTVAYDITFGCPDGLRQ